jgi:tetratricopeptide (TPR) repeat protein
LLLLADRFEKLEQWNDAYETWRTLLRDYPDQIEKPVAYRRLAALAERLEKSDEARQYRQMLETALPQGTNPPAAKAP